ncbi:MAG: hypothetical protein E4H03_04100, partial [Myxococcales bacterium]
MPADAGSRAGTTTRSGTQRTAPSPRNVSCREVGPVVVRSSPRDQLTVLRLRLTGSHATSQRRPAMAGGAEPCANSAHLLRNGSRQASAAMATNKKKSADRRQVTILFADISGFTALSQRMEPDDVHETMNRCFDAIGGIIRDRGGTVDKYIGDCVMALFGAPVALEHAPRQALNAAIEIRNRIENLNAEMDLPAELGVHIGVNTGLVVAGDLGDEVKHDYTVISPAVNLAARLYDAADRGETYVGRSTYRYTEKDFEFKELKPLVLKGIDEPVPAYELLSREERVYRIRPGDEDAELSSGLVGREQELTVITDAFVRVATAPGRVLAVIGENGLGKSRLMAEAMRSQAAGAIRLLEARSISTGGSLPFHPFIDLFAGWAGARDRSSDAANSIAVRDAVRTAGAKDPLETAATLASMMGLPLSEDERDTLRDVAGDALEKLIHRNVEALLGSLADRAPLAIVFEDLHWADQSSLAMLEALLTLTIRKRVLFILVCRPEYENTSDRILTHCAKALPEAIERVRLQPLTAIQCDTLIENLFGTDQLPAPVRDLIKRDTDGNPFYIEEVIRALIEKDALRRVKDRVEATSLLPSIELPATIEEVIMTRVDHLDADARHLLQVASVIGRRFRLKILERMLPDIEGIDGLLAVLNERRFVLPAATRASRSRKLVRFERDREYAFRHALIQDSVYGSLMNRDRKRLHGVCATAIEEVYADRIQDAYGMLAYHCTRGEDPVRAEEYLLKAGEEAARTAASAEALQYFREGYRVYLEIHGERADTQKKAQLEKNIALALVNTGNLVESIDHFDVALRLYGQRVPTSSAGTWLQVVGDLSAVMLHAYVGSRRGGPRRDHSDEHDMFSCLYSRCRAVNIVDPNRSFFYNMAAMRYLGHVDPAAVDQAPGMYAATGAFFAFAGLSFRIGKRFLRIAESLARAERPLDRILCRTMGFVLHFHAGEWSREYELDDSLLEQALRYGLLWDADVYLGMLCERNLRQGSFEAAEVNLARLGELSRVFGYEFARSNELAMRGFLRLEQRRLDEARTELQAYYDLRHEDPQRILALSGLARVDALGGDLERARARIDAAARLVVRARQLVPFYLGAYRTTQLLVDVESLAAEPRGSGERRARASAKRARRTALKIARELPQT